MKYFLIISPIILTIFLVIVLVFISLSGTKHIPTSNFSPTPTSTPLESTIQQKTPLSLVSTVPQDQSAQVTIYTPISFTFNRPVLPNELSFSSVPPLNLNTQVDGNTVTLTPSQALTKDTTYYIFAVANNRTQTFSFSFATISTQPQTPPPTDITYFGSGADNTHQTEDQLTLKQHPDIYLYNRCPYTSSDFSVVSDFTDTPAAHYYFSVTLSGNIQTAKSNFTSWVLSLGITQNQFKQLDIRYQ